MYAMSAYTGLTGGATMQYLTSSDTRSHLREVLDTAEAGLPIGIRRHDKQIALIESSRLQEILMDSRRLRRPETVAEAGGWSVFLPGTPVAADGTDLDEAVHEFVSALREYAEDWQEWLRFAPNHRHNWPLVQLASLASDADLAEWVSGIEP